MQNRKCLLNNDQCENEIDLNPFYKISQKTDLSDSFCSSQNPSCLYEICSLDIYYAKKIEQLIFEKLKESSLDFTPEIAEIGTCTGSGGGGSSNPSKCSIPEHFPCSELTPCQNGAVCNDLSSFDYECVCPAGFTGKNCETEIPCHSNPCQNMGTCENSVDFSDYVCECTSQYTGENCEIPIPCEFDPCSEFAVSCENSQDFLSYRMG